MTRFSANLRQILVILGVSLVLGVGINLVSPKPLPLVASPEQFTVEAEGGVVWEELLLLFESGEAVFVDARSTDMFAAGHIPGSISIPYKAFEHGVPAEVELLPRDQPIVVYCDGADCHASPVVTDKLLELGFTKDLVRTFSGGWTKWVEMKMEIEKGGTDAGQ
jgi:rhodanese-related sulfurtransferase